MHMRTDWLKQTKKTHVKLKENEGKRGTQAMQCRDKEYTLTYTAQRQHIRAAKAHTQNDRTTRS